MMHLTKTAWKTWLALITANALLFFAAFQSYGYYLKSRSVHIPPTAIRNLLTLANQLQQSPEERWPAILRQHPDTPFNIGLSLRPAFGENASLTLNPAVIFDALKKNHQFKISLFVRKNVWLNIEISSPNPLGNRVFLSLALLLLLLFLAVNFLIVKGINRPIETIIQSLEDTELQEHWTPIPLTGNAEQKTIFRKINLLQKKLHKLLANRTQVVAAISHDLRTPLTRLKLRAENLPQDANTQKILNDIHEMEIMIRDTLDYFRDTHHTELHQPFDLSALIHSIQEDAEESGKNVSFSTNTDRLVYTGAMNLLKRALTNIIDNAIQYGGHTAITLEKTGESLHIVITDAGPGLAEDTLNRVFQPFYRAEQSRSRETGGTGLGLTIAREIVEMHGGTITLKNRAQGGLEVHISLPASGS